MLFSPCPERLCAKRDPLQGSSLHRVKRRAESCEPQQALTLRTFAAFVIKKPQSSATQLTEPTPESPLFSSLPPLGAGALSVGRSAYRCTSHCCALFSNNRMPLCLIIYKTTDASPCQSLRSQIVTLMGHYQD